MGLPPGRNVGQNVIKMCSSVVINTDLSMIQCGLIQDVPIPYLSGHLGAPQLIKETRWDPW